MLGAQLRWPRWERTRMGASPPSRNGNEASDRVFPVGGGGLGTSGPALAAKTEETEGLVSGPRT